MRKLLSNAALAGGKFFAATFGCLVLAVSAHAQSCPTEQTIASMDASAVNCDEQSEPPTNVADVAPEAELLPEEFHAHGKALIAEGKANDGLAFIVAACEHRQMEACVELQPLYEAAIERGETTLLDYGISVGLLCASGAYPPFCDLYGRNFIEALDQSDSSERRRGMMAQAREMLKHGCDAGEPNSCGELGRTYYVSRQHIDHDYALAAELLKTSCEISPSDFCAEYPAALNLATGGAGQIGEDASEARRLLERGCNEGNSVKSCGGLGELLYLGIGGPVDRVTGASLVQNACGQGLMPSCFLHYRILTGNNGGVPTVEAVRLARLTCEQGRVARACFDMAEMVANTHYTGLPSAAAPEYMAFACQLGLPEACAQIESGRYARQE